MENYLHIIYKWYIKNKRDLPWRHTIDPYKIWISEVILQQTRIAQGVNYYLRFIDKFPSVTVLANSDEKEVLKIWQGLGYYSRARNLHKGARQIVSEFSGKFPTTYHDIISVKGIGVYTAAAIASIAFHLPYPAVDGNVYRFLARFFNIDVPIDSTKGKKEFYQLSESILLKNDPGMHNQALMEFGALQCVPQNPDCFSCPINDGCLALRENRIRILPVKQKSTKQIIRYFNYFVIEDKDHFYIQKRLKKDIWENLYEFPLIETAQKTTVEKILNSEEFREIIDKDEIFINKISKENVHVLSHQKISTKFIHIIYRNIEKAHKDFIKVKKEELDNYPVSRLIEKYIEENIL